MADRNLRMNIDIGRGGLRDAARRGCHDTSILWDVTHRDPQAQVHLRGGGADRSGRLPLPQRRTSANTALARDTCLSTNGAINLRFSRWEA